MAYNLRVRRRNHHPGRKARRALLKTMIEDIKMARGCRVCGSRTAPCDLHFHHRDPQAKGFTISKIIAQGPGVDRVLNEIDKCDVLCSRHHIELELRHVG